MSTGRLAHKPVCDATRPRLLRAGSLVACRGCTMMWLGVACGVAAAAFSWIGAIAGSVLLLVGLAGLHPPLYASLPNVARDASRTALGLAPLPLVIGAWRAGFWYPAAVALWLCGLFVLRAMNVRRLRPRHRCEACAPHGS